MHKKVRFIVAFIVCLFIQSCILSEPDDGPDKDPTSAPEVSKQIDDGDEVYYTPPTQDDPADVTSVEDSPNGDTPARRCKFKTVVYKTDVHMVEKQFDFGGLTDVENVSDNINGDFRDKMEDAEYVHLSEVVVYSVRGDNFAFLSWVKVYVQNKELDNFMFAWRDDPPRTKELSLHVDGAKEIKRYVVNKGTTIQGQARASSPSVDTKLKGVLDFIVLYDCE